MGPLDQFKIVEYFNCVIPFTNSALGMFMSSVSAIQVFLVWPQISKTASGLVELYFEFIEGLANQTIGQGHRFLVPFISGLFSFILFGNLIGLVPGCFTFTSHLVPNAVLASIVILAVLLIGLIRNGVSFLQLFCPSSVPLLLIPLITPIELITFFVRIPALAMRLCINMAVGHMLIEIFALLAAQLGPVVGLLHIPCLALECVTAVLQAYIFTMLSCIYLKDAVQFHH
jgi:F-type H+-transporting ATPase subunit a